VTPLRHENELRHRPGPRRSPRTQSRTTRAAGPVAAAPQRPDGRGPFEPASPGPDARPTASPLHWQRSGRSDHRSARGGPAGWGRQGAGGRYPLRLGLWRPGLRPGRSRPATVRAVQVSRADGRSATVRGPRMEGVVSATVVELRSSPCPLPVRRRTAVTNRMTGACSANTCGPTSERRAGSMSMIIGSGR
jgi:hypothetical protein